MKIARTFTIDYHLYQELRNKSNQSQIVCKAVRRYLANMTEIDETDISTNRLLYELLQRKDLPKSIRLLISDHLTSS